MTGQVIGYSSVNFAMAIERGVKYEVRDKEGRVWGSVTLTKEFDDVLHVKVEPKRDFQKVEPLFRALDRFVETSDWQSYPGHEIAELEVVLVSGNGEAEPVGIVYVNECGVFSCGV